jgi:hypothetical protein
MRAWFRRSAMTGAALATAIMVSSGAQVASAATTSAVRVVPFQVVWEYGGSTTTYHNFKAGWTLYLRADDVKGRLPMTKMPTNDYCEALPNMLGWSVLKKSCTVKRGGAGYIVVNRADFVGPRICVMNVCTPSPIHTLGSIIEFDRLGMQVSERKL